MKNALVVDNWMNGNCGKGSGLSTDGESLWSYKLLIGFTGDENVKVVKDYTGINKLSTATTRHINLAKEVSGVFMTPHSSTVNEVRQMLKDD